MTLFTSIFQESFPNFKTLYDLWDNIATTSIEQHMAASEGFHSFSILLFFFK